MIQKFGMNYLKISAQPFLLPHSERSLSGVVVLGGVAVTVLAFNLCGRLFKSRPRCWKVGSYLPIPGGLQHRILTN